jgi:hypothetical protein
LNVLINRTEASTCESNTAEMPEIFRKTLVCAEKVWKTSGKFSFVPQK